MKPLRVILAYGHYNVGDVIHPTGLFREQLIRQHLCEEVEREEGDAVECATVAPDECAVMRTSIAPSKKKRRRQRATVE